jgi:hypothetical protein
MESQTPPGPSDPPDPNDPTQRIPPQPPPPGSPPPPSGYGMPTISWDPGARLPLPGNAEWLLWFVVELVFAIIWAASDQVDAALFVVATTVLTFGYLISRGIAKASRVLEQ